MLGLIEDERTALVTPESHNGVKRANSGLQARPYGLVNERFDEKLIYVEFGDHLLQNLKKKHCHIGKQRK